jgi:Ca2+-binding RTX toxin-like protein
LSSDGAGPDLIVPSDISPFASTLLQGGESNATADGWAIRNIGDAPAPAGVVVRILLSEDATPDAGDVILAQWTGITTIPTGRAFDVLGDSVLVPDDLPPGDYWAIAVIDVDGIVDESDEANNVAAFAVEYAPSEDDAAAPDPDPEPPAGVFERGGAGPDRLIGGDGGDRLVGRGGNDTLKGGDGDDLLKGGGGRDRLAGQRGDDTLKGGGGKDTLKGGGGDDLLQGQRGGDRLKSGGGEDTLRFKRGDGKDVVLDWKDGKDLIHILKGAGGFDDLEIQERRGHAFVDYGKPGDVIKLRKTDADDLDASDFLFG